MKTFTIIVYNDPSHAWGKVKRKVLDNLGLAQQVSSYSYQYKDNVYLEAPSLCTTTRPMHGAK